VAARAGQAAALRGDESGAGSAACLLPGYALEKALIGHISGLAKFSARETCAQIGLDGSLTCAETDVPTAAEAVAAFCSGLPGMAAPVYAHRAHGTGDRLFPPFPYRSYAAADQKPADSLSAAMDAYYLGRDLRMRYGPARRGAAKAHQNQPVPGWKRSGRSCWRRSRESEKAEQFRLFGELLTANLHLVRPGVGEAQVTDYYDPSRKP
jgi:hypothetical protein